MKLNFYINNDSGIPQSKKSTPKKFNFNGNDFTYVGKSKENPAITTRVKALFECFIGILGSCLVIPCFFKGFRKNFKNAGRELLSGQELVKYYVLNPHVFDKKSSIVNLTEEELFNKGLADSQNAKFD
jgi:hypothetical protein